MKSTFFHIDNVLSTILVILILKFLPILFQIDFLDPIQNTLEDFEITDIAFSQLQDKSKIEKDTNIVLVNIGMLNRYGIAAQIEMINEHKPKVIGIDSFFRSLKDPVTDSILAEVFKNVENLVLVSKLDRFNWEKEYWDTLEKSNDIFSVNAEYAYANFIIEESNFMTVRDFTPFQYYRDSVQMAFAVKICSLYDDDAVRQIKDRGEETEIINFKRNIDKYETFDVEDIFDKKKDLSFVKDKIVLMGFMGKDIKTLTNQDIFYTSNNDQYVGKNYPDMYGVVVWANIISMMLENEYYNRLPFWMSQVLIILIIYFNMSLLTYLRLKRPRLYEPVSIIWTFLELFLLFWLMLGSFYLLKTEIELSGLFFAVLIGKQGYEVWVDSLKLMFKGRFDRIRKFLGGMKKL